jgi:hypothetical protein
MTVVRFEDGAADGRVTVEGRADAIKGRVAR